MGGCSHHEEIWQLDTSNITSSISKTPRVDESEPEELGSYARVFIRKQPMRRQNRACDSCRLSKKACNLSVDMNILRGHRVIKSCTTCKIKGLQCTAAWLFKKRAQREKKRTKGAILVPNISSTKAVESVLVTDACGSLAPSAVEATVSRQIMGETVCLEYFLVYINAFDIPISQCLLQGSLPPQYSQGISAYVPLSTEPPVYEHIHLTNSWIAAHWPMNNSNFVSLMDMVATPHLFYGAYTLDVFFGSRNAPNNSPSRFNRDQAINDAYKWAAVATATQFAKEKTENIDGDDKGSDKGTALPNNRDIVSCAWNKARSSVFGSISATTSFRHAMALVLFGMIPSADYVTGNGTAHDQDSVYAVGEGLRRLLMLCTKARAQLAADDGTNTVENLAADNLQGSRGQELRSGVKSNLLELLGAMEWMVSMVNSLTIATSKGNVCPLPIERHHLRNSSADGQSLDKVHTSWPSDREISNLIVSRAKAQPTTVVMYEDLGFEEAMLQAGRQTTCLTFLIWKFLARFVLATKAITNSTRSCSYETLCQQYKTISSLCALWRNTFGSITSDTILALHQTQSRNMFAFHANNGNMAILLFHEVVQDLKTRLCSVLPDSPAQLLADTLQYSEASHKKQRLLSAVMISTMISSFNGESDLEAGSSTTRLEKSATYPVSLELPPRRINPHFPVMASD